MLSPAGWSIKLQLTWMKRMNTTFSIVTAGSEVQTLQSSLRQVIHLTPVSMRRSRHKIAQDRILYCFEEGSGTLINIRMFVWQKELKSYSEQIQKR